MAPGCVALAKTKHEADIDAGTRRTTMAETALTVAAARTYRVPVEDLLECVDKAVMSGRAGLS